MSYDSTGRLTVLGGRLCQVWDVHTCLFCWQAGDPLPWGSLSYALEEGRYERVPEGRIYWSEGVPYVWGDLLHKFPLLLE